MNPKLHSVFFVLGFGFAILFISISISVSAETLCSSDAAISEDGLQLLNYGIEGKKPLYLGDTVIGVFDLRYFGGKFVTFDDKYGVFFLVENDKKKFYVANSHQGETLSFNQKVHVEAKIALDTPGNWTIKPGYCLKNSKCFYFEGCKLEVFVECGNCECLTEGDAKEKFGYYEKCSEYKCGYEVGPSLAALQLIPKYCYHPTSNRPDLEILDIQPYGEMPGLYTKLKYYVKNAGNLTSPSSTSALFIDGLKIAEHRIDELQPGELRIEWYPYDWVCSGDADILAVQLDANKEVDELNETNNYMLKESPCPEKIGIPDLTAVSIKHNESGLYCKNRVFNASNYLEFEVVNSGNGSSISTNAYVYLDGRWVDTIAIPQIEAGGNYTGKTKFSMACTGESDEITVKIDPGNRVFEANELNNELTKTFSCFVETYGTPDLVITDLQKETVKTIDIGGNSYPLESKIKFKVRNAGNGPACNFEAGFYVDGSMKGRSGISPLAPGEEVERFFTYNWTACTPPSDSFAVRADWKDEISEGNENNNELSRTWNCVEYPSQIPDLVITNVVVRPDFRIIYTIKNVGSAPCGETTTLLLINGETVLTSRVPALDPGDEIELAFPPWTPQWLTNLLELCADMDNEVSEVSELNNCFLKYWKIDESCENGIRDGDEEGVDCGGSLCSPCDPCDAATLPSVFDWRTYSVLPPVRNQGGCGSCWAFSAVGAVECSYFIEQNASSFEFNLSEQNLVSSCCSAGSCNGGHANKALNYIKNSGIVSEACFPYQSADSSCDFCSRWEEKLTSVGYVKKVSSDIDAIKRALVCHGPLSACSSNWEHCIVIVGYNDFGSSWIIRNSWGNWRDHGYGELPYSGHPYSDVKNMVYYVETVSKAYRHEFEEGDAITVANMGLRNKIYVADHSDYEIEDIKGFGYGSFAGKWSGFGAGDVNGDGRDELVVAERGDQVRVIGEVQVGETLHTGEIQSFALDFEEGDGLAVGDVNGDGVAEIVHGDRADRIQIFDYQGNLLSQFSLDFEKGDGLAVGDVNGDGVAEIIHGDRDDWIRIYDADGGILSQFHTKFEERDGLVAADVDGDGIDEIVQGDRADWIKVFDMQGRLLKKQRLDFEYGDGLAAGDMDGDGRDEIVHADRADIIRVMDIQI